MPERLDLPLRWKKPRRIFVDSMSDLFHERLTNEEIAAVFGVMATASRHTFQVLTKRADRLREWFAWIGGGEPEVDLVRLHADDALTAVGLTIGERTKLGLGTNAAAWPLPNVWIGVSVEHQRAADERIPELLRTPAAVRFLSCEPLLDRVDLGWHLDRRLSNQHGDPLPTANIDWIIAGCESGRDARPCDVEWLRLLRDQAAEAGVAFFLKQAVELATSRALYPSSQSARVETVHVGRGDGSRRKHHGVIELPYLDGVQHAGFPEVRHG